MSPSASERAGEIFQQLSPIQKQNLLRIRSKFLLLRVPSCFDQEPFRANDNSASGVDGLA